MGVDTDSARVWFPFLVHLLEESARDERRAGVTHHDPVIRAVALRAIPGYAPSRHRVAFLNAVELGASEPVSDEVPDVGRVHQHVPHGPHRPLVTVHFWSFLGCGRFALVSLSAALRKSHPTSPDT